MEHRAVKRLFVRRILPIIALLIALKVAVEARGFFLAVQGTGSTGTPFQKQILLSHGAQLLAKGVTECGGMQGDCGSSARLRIRWKSGATETVDEHAQFGEPGWDGDSALLSRHGERWKLQIGGRTWTRDPKSALWK